MLFFRLDESYKLLEQRMGVSLNTRLINKRRRMADEGICKSKRDKLNQLDVIADDKKLIEGYIAVIKDMAIKYGVADMEVSDELHTNTKIEALKQGLCY